MKRFLLFLVVVLSQCAWEWPNGWDMNAIKPSSINYPGTVATTNQTLTVGQSGNTIVFNNSTGVAANDTQFTLPSAIPGLDYTFIGDVAKYIAILPQSTEIINFSTAIAGQGVRNSTSPAIGDSIELECRTSGQWSVKNRVGTWTVGS